MVGNILAIFFTIKLHFTFDILTFDNFLVYAINIQNHQKKKKKNPTIHKIQIMWLAISNDVTFDILIQLPCMYNKKEKHPQKKKNPTIQ